MLSAAEEYLTHARGGSRGGAGSSATAAMAQPDPPQHVTTLLDLPNQVIFHHIFPRLPASTIYATAELHGSWAAAFNQLLAPIPADATEVLEEHPLRLQPVMGGTEESGFLLENAELTRRGPANVVAPDFEGTFPGRMPRVLAVRSGVILMLLRNPDGLVIWNPVDNQQILVDIPGYPSLEENFDKVDMYVDVVPGAFAVRRIDIVFPYVVGGEGLHPVHAVVRYEGIRYCKWSLDNPDWDMQDGLILVPEYFPRPGAVIIGTTFYHQMSDRVVGWYRLPGQGGEGAQIGDFVTPVLEGVSKRDTILCEYDGRLGFLAVDEFRGDVLLYTRQGDEWILEEPVMFLPGGWVREEPILLSQNVLKFRISYGSRGVFTRRYPRETENEVGAEARLVSMFKNKLFIFIRERWMALDVCMTVKPLVLNLGAPPEPPLLPCWRRFFPYTTSLVRLQHPDANAAAAPVQN